MRAVDTGGGDAAGAEGSESGLQERQKKRKKDKKEKKEKKEKKARLQHGADAAEEDDGKQGSARLDADDAELEAELFGHSDGDAPMPEDRWLMKIVATVAAEAAEPAWAPAVPPSIALLHPRRAARAALDAALCAAVCGLACGSMRQEGVGGWWSDPLRIRPPRSRTSG
ncbi:unnamed protein product [Prorocentrum cordatum]|uniref:Uncharacterized protein n=1 Tax=Prorocentrum cordatum TaxID=2364126 RepID=A0ABN9XSL1_9DINO|nr:unnamed protein product [Polarella glacialis]